MLAGCFEWLSLQCTWKEAHPNRYRRTTLMNVAVGQNCRVRLMQLLGSYLVMKYHTVHSKDVRSYRTGKHMHDVRKSSMSSYEHHSGVHE